MTGVLQTIGRWFRSFLGRNREPLPRHLHHGRMGEAAACDHLVGLGLKFLTANFKSRRGEIDLIVRDKDCLVFVEVKTRSWTSWTRPAAAVNWRKRKRLSKAALDYLRLLGHPRVKFRFDIVEVIHEDGRVTDIRHLPNTFELAAPRKYF